VDTFFMEGRVIMGCDEHIIHINDEPSFAEFFFEDGVHHHLKGGWGVGQAKEHHHWFEESFIGDEGRFPLVSVSDPYIVVSPSYVELGEKCSASSFVD